MWFQFLSLLRSYKILLLIESTSYQILFISTFTFRALKRIDIPVMIFWGNSDAVAPMEIPKHLATHVIPAGKLTGKYLKETGHFLMLEKPNEWSQIISQFILK